LRETKTGNNKYLKELNKATILDLIRTTSGVSRKALADFTGLSPTATGAIVRELLKDQFIREVGEGESSGGRKPVILEINPDSYYAFGFDIDMSFIYTVVLDITGKVHYEEKWENRSSLSPEEAVDRIKRIYDTVVSRLKIKKDRILGVGVSIPGMLDITTRRIYLAPNLGWSNVDIKESLGQELGAPVYLDNEARCSAFCENWLGICRGVEDFVCINIESGIGAGIFVRGMIYRGFTGSAGEVGHISVDENGPRCKCGNVGCLETMASINAMAERYREMAVKSNPDVSKNTIEQNFEALLQGALEGDRACIRIFKEAAVSLGKAIGYLINAFNPQTIVIGKKFPRYANLVLDDIAKSAAKTALAHLAENCSIVPSSFGENSSALGAAIIPIRKLFGK